MPLEAPVTIAGFSNIRIRNALRDGRPAHYHAGFLYSVTLMDIFTEHPALYVDAVLPASGTRLWKR